MSFDTWTVEAYGVRETALDGISDEAIIKKFKELHGKEVKDAEEMDDEDWLNYIADEYADEGMCCSMHGIVGEMVSKKLFKKSKSRVSSRVSENIVMDCNEYGEEIIGIVPAYPWYKDAEYRALTKAKINKAFVDTFKELGAELDRAEIDCQEMKNWG